MSGTNKLTLSWSTNVPGYVLQERTNLEAGSWAPVSSGTKPPVVITVSNGQTFYRLKNTNEEPAVVLLEPVPAAETLSGEPPILRRRIGMQKD